MNAVDDFHRTMFSTRFVPWCDTQCVASPPSQRETVARFIDSLAERGCHLDSVTIIWTAIMQAHADAGLEDPFRSLAGIADAVSALGRIPKHLTRPRTKHLAAGYVWSVFWERAMPAKAMFHNHSGATIL